MEFVSLAIFAVAVVGLGSAATILLAQSISPQLADLAAKHGRFVGLRTADEGTSPASPASRYPLRVQRKSIDVVGSSN